MIRMRTTLVAVFLTLAVSSAWAVAGDPLRAEVSDAIGGAVAWYQAGFPGEATISYPNSDDIAAHYALAFLSLGRPNGHDWYRAEGLALLNELLLHADDDGDGWWGWGLNQESYSSLDDTMYPAEIEYTYTTCVVGEALFAAYHRTHDRRWLSAAVRVCDSLANHIGYVENGPGRIFVRYAPTPLFDNLNVLNVTANAGSLWLRVGRRAHRGDLIRLGTMALADILALQNADGSWFYAEDRTTIQDSVHAALIARSVLQAYEETRRGDYREAALRGIPPIWTVLWRNGELRPRQSPLRPYWYVGEPLVLFTMAERLFRRDFNADTLVANIVEHESAGIFYDDSFRRAHSWILYGLAEWSVAQPGHQRTRLGR